MDRGREGDASNFFNRIKNVDVLKSPYPRHLAQNSHHSGVATSVRPIVGGNTVPHNTMRPAPTRAAPVWQGPSPRSDLSNSTHTGGGSSNRSHNSEYGRVPPSPALYRPPPEYPNSVQPIRVRPYGMSDYRQVPGSTFPSHVSAGLSAGRNMSTNTSYCVLRKWIVCVDIEKMAVTVSGSFTKPNGNTVTRHSSSIEMAIDERVVRASSGTIYQLVDTPDLDLMRSKGFPEYLIPFFTDGFPRNWKRLVDDYLAVAAGVQRGRGGPLSRRDSYSMMNRVTSPNGNLHNEHRVLDSGNERYRRSSEDGDAADLQSSTSPVCVYGTSSHTGIQQTRPFDFSVSAHAQTNGTGQVYRSGADIFANGRYSRAGGLQTPVRTQQDLHGHSSEAFRSPERYEADDAKDKGAVVNTVEEDRYMPSMQRIDSELAAAMTNMPLETPTKGCSSAGTGEMLSDTISPELGATNGLSWKTHYGANISLNDSTIEPFKLDDAEDSQSDQEGFIDSQLPDSAVVDTVKDLPQKSRKQTLSSQRKPRRTSRKIVDSSDEALSQATAEAHAGETLAATPVTRSQKRSDATPVSVRRPTRNSASATRKPALATPNKRKDATKIPSSAPTGRAKTTSGAHNRRSAKRTAKNVVAAAEQTPSKPPRTRKSAERQCVSSSTSNAMVVIEPLVKPSSNADTDTDSETSAPAWAVVESQAKTKTAVASKNKQKKSLPASATDDELPLPPPSPPTQEPPAIADESESTPTKAAPSVKSESTASRWKVGRRFFKYKEAEATTSVTRSGRKVRRPQQWWANAQEHLASPHKESAIKYRWGTGDAVVVRDGKRMRLSDVFLEGSSADLYLAEQNIDAKGDAATSDTANDA